MEDTDDDELPEAVRLHSAVAACIMCLEMIARAEGPPPRVIARTCLNILRQRHPDVIEHMTPEPDAS